MPPIKHRALVPEALNVTQRGEELILSWPKPGVVVLQESKVVRADILRRDEKRILVGESDLRLQNVKPRYCPSLEPILLILQLALQQLD